MINLTLHYNSLIVLSAVWGIAIYTDPNNFDLTPNHEIIRVGIN